MNCCEYCNKSYKHKGHLNNHTCEQGKRELDKIKKNKQKELEDLISSMTPVEKFMYKRIIQLEQQVAELSNSDSDYYHNFGIK